MGFIDKEYLINQGLDINSHEALLDNLEGPSKSNPPAVFSTPPPDEDLIVLFDPDSQQYHRIPVNDAVKMGWISARLVGKSKPDIIRTSSSESIMSLDELSFEHADDKSEFKVSKREIPLLDLSALKPSLPTLTTEKLVVPDKGGLRGGSSESMFNFDTDLVSSDSIAHSSDLITSSHSLPQIKISESAPFSTSKRFILFSIYT